MHSGLFVGYGEDDMSTIDEDPSVYNGHLEVAVVIDRPVAMVWKQWLDLGSWVTSHTIEEIFGTRGAVESIVRVSLKNARELGLPKPHHHYCKLTKVVPHQQYVLKTYSEKGGSYGMQMTAFDDTRFVTNGKTTKVTFNFYCEYKGDVVARDPASMNLDAAVQNMVKNLDHLKQLVESG
jgi:hypothetical protein